MRRRRDLRPVAARHNAARRSHTRRGGRTPEPQLAGRETPHRPPSRGRPHARAAARAHGSPMRNTCDSRRVRACVAAQPRGAPRNRLQRKRGTSASKASKCTGESGERCGDLCVLEHIGMHSILPLPASEPGDGQRAGKHAQWQAASGRRAQGRRNAFPHNGPPEGGGDPVRILTTRMCGGTRAKCEKRGEARRRKRGDLKSEASCHSRLRARQHREERRCA